MVVSNCRWGVVSLQELSLSFFYWDAGLLLLLLFVVVGPCIGDDADGGAGEVAGVDAEEEEGGSCCPLPPAAAAATAAAAVAWLALLLTIWNMGQFLFVFIWPSCPQLPQRRIAPSRLPRIKPSTGFSANAACLANCRCRRRSALRLSLAKRSCKRFFIRSFFSASSVGRRASTLH